jgi:hypothetical protein
VDRSQFGKGLFRRRLSIKPFNVQTLLSHVGAGRRHQELEMSRKILPRAPWLFALLSVAAAGAVHADTLPKASDAMKVMEPDTEDPQPVRLSGAALSAVKHLRSSAPDARGPQPSPYQTLVAAKNGLRTH